MDLSDGRPKPKDPGVQIVRARLRYRQRIAHGLNFWREPIALHNFSTSLQIPGGQASSCTFVITEEDHTLGNSLRYAVMRKFVTRLNAESSAAPCPGLAL
jgi:hypothetical protein